MKIKVSITDDHLIVANGVSTMLKEHPLIELTGVCTNGKQLLAHLEQQQPDVLLLDIQLPDMQGDELARLITEKYPLVSILVLTNMDQVFYVRNMFMNGVKGYLLKSADTTTLVEAITAVYRGQQYVDSNMQQQMAYELLDARKAQTIPKLTKREQKILELIASEMTNTEIAKELYLSISTVETHRLNLFFKLGVKNAAGLVRKGIQMGLIK